MVANVDDFLIEFKKIESQFIDPNYDEEIIHCDLNHLKGAVFVGQDIKMYELCSFLGIRHIGSSHNKLESIDDIKRILLDGDYITVLVADVKLIDESIDVEEVHNFAKSINKVFHVYGRDSSKRLLRNVNIYRSNDKYFC